MMRTRAFLLLLLLGGATGCTTDRSLDLTLGDTGLSFGNSAVLDGLRFNLVDADVERVRGVNVTFWVPEENPEFVQRGIALGLLKTCAHDMVGLSLAPVAGGDDLLGVNLGLLSTWGSGAVRGLNLGTAMVYGGERLAGLNAGLMVAGGGDIQGLTLSGLYISPRPVTDLYGPPEGTLAGLSLCGLVVDYPVIAGGNFGGIVRARELTGLSLAWLLHDVRAELTGLAVAPFNSAERLRGVQVGLLNHVASHPWLLRWLPFVNVGFGGPPE